MTELGSSLVMLAAAWKCPPPLMERLSVSMLCARQPNAAAKHGDRPHAASLLALSIVQCNRQKRCPYVPQTEPPLVFHYTLSAVLLP